MTASIFESEPTNLYVDLPEEEDAAGLEYDQIDLLIKVLKAQIEYDQCFIDHNPHFFLREDVFNEIADLKVLVAFFEDMIATDS